MRHTPRGIGMIEILVIALACLVVAAIVYPFFARRPERNHPVSCLNNQRQIVVAVQIRAQENYERLPTFAQVRESFQDERVFTCSQSTNSHRYGYGYNADVRGKSLGLFPEPDQILITADSIKPNALIRSSNDIAINRHKTGFVASYLDGHVQYEKAGTAVRLK